MGFLSPELLLVKSKKLNLGRGILCQNSNDSRGSKNLQALIMGEEI